MAPKNGCDEAEIKLEANRSVTISEGGDSIAPVF
jgi:hypothetical protein